MAQSIYRTAMMLALLVVFGAFALNYSQTGSITGNAAVVRYAYLDADGDGYGDPNTYITNAYRQPEGYVTNNLDCDDTDYYRHPGAAQICKIGVDNDCDGILDIDENPVVCHKAL